MPRPYFLPFTPQGEATERQAIRVKATLGLPAEAAVDPDQSLTLVPARMIDPGDLVARAPALANILFDVGRNEWSAIGYGRDASGTALILANPTHHPHRQRVSVMEEIVHLVLDHPKTILRFEAPGKIRWYRPYDKAIEDEAYSVGAACILPYPGLFHAVQRERQTAAAIAEAANVSAEYVVYRIRRAGLGRIYAKRQRERVDR